MEEYVRKWLIRANNDLRVAENELGLPKEQRVGQDPCDPDILLSLRAKRSNLI
jgi:hypothetical protein